MNIEELRSKTKAELYTLADDLDVAGRGSMNKAELLAALSSLFAAEIGTTDDSDAPTDDPDVPTDAPDLPVDASDPYSVRAEAARDFIYEAAKSGWKHIRVPESDPRVQEIVESDLPHDIRRKVCWG